MAEEKKIEGFSNIKFTASGLLLEAKLKTGVPLKITRAVIGTGYLDDGEDVANLTALKSEIESHQTGVTSSSATVDITNVSVVAAGMTNLRIKNKKRRIHRFICVNRYNAQDPVWVKFYICTQIAVTVHRHSLCLMVATMCTELLIF